MSSPRDVDARGYHYVYRLYAATGQLLYIGVTEDVEHRVYMHLQTTVAADWLVIHRRYSHHTSRRYPNKVIARRWERASIEAEAPLLNRQHNPTRWSKRRQGYVPTPETAAEIAALMAHTPEEVERAAEGRRWLDGMSGGVAS